MKIIINDPCQQLTDQQKQTKAQSIVQWHNALIRHFRANGEQVNGAYVVIKSRVSDQDEIGKILES